MRRLWLLLITLAAVWIAALIQAGRPLGWDEIEFFRASRWIGEGKVPFRDFWEHHTPLQWMIFAPAARLLGNGSGVASIVAMRWAQVAVWIGIFAVLFRLGRRAGVDPTAQLASTALLLASPTFIHSAIEFRVDVVGNLFWLLGVLLAVAALTRPRAMTFGVLMAAAVLANMRLVPLVVMTSILVIFWRAPERRWGFNLPAIWMVPGAFVTGAAFVGWLRLTHAFKPFLEGVVRYNVESARNLDVQTFWVTVLQPVSEADPAGICFWLAGMAGVVLAIRGLVQPGPLQFLVLLWVASIATIGAMKVQYPYHFQGVWLLMLPLGAEALSRILPKWSVVAGLVVTVSLVLAALPLVGTFGKAMEYQDLVMRSVERVTRPEEAVWDGCGYALRRKPADRYWFLPTGIRLLASEHRLADPFDPAMNPPAAVIYNLRILRWFQIYPKSAFFVSHHYVPLYQNLWIPGLSAPVAPGRTVRWSMVRSGTYDLYASEVLLRHPWFKKPVVYATTQGPMAARLGIPLNELPPADSGWLHWKIDGKDVPADARRIAIRQGARVEFTSSAPRELGVLVVPAGISELGRGPSVKFEF